MGKYNTVVFRIDFQEGMEFPEISNFIYKVENHEKLTLEEVQHISFQYYRVSERISEAQWAEEIRKKSQSYFYIKNPEQIVNLDESYQIIYGIVLDESQLKDFVEIQNLYLIKNNLKKACILGLLSGTDSYYFKMSQYLSSVYEHYPEFYNQVLFYKDKPVRLQLHNLQYSRQFMPLQIINEKTVGCLFQKTGDVIRREDMEKMIFSRAKICMDTETESIIGGAVKILQKHSKYLSRIGAEEFSRLMEDVNLLTFVFFACFIKTTGKKSDTLNQWTYAGVRNCLIQMEQYAHACRQLAENIVFHSQSGEGCLSLRIHSGTTRYIKEKYTLTESEADTYFEIVISDYAADNAGGNIAENFQRSLSDVGSALIFKGMTPKDFFGKSFGIESAFHDQWKKYYENPSNIGKHFGLKVFEKIIYQNSGIFIAESHSRHTSVSTEIFSNMIKAENKKKCLPGTKYSIMFPLQKAQKEIFSFEKSFGSRTEIRENIDDIYKLRVDDRKQAVAVREYHSQQEKDDCIKVIAGQLQKLMEDSKADVLYISTENVSKEYGEVLAKASVLALYHAEEKKHLVFYDALDSFYDEFYGTMRVFCEDTGIGQMLYGIEQQIVVYTKKLDEKVFKLSHAEMSANPFDFIPFDILGERSTLFERYTECVLREDIQREQFGARIKETHLRLGSAIHIDEFYEAEIIFGSQFFVSRFAHLCVKRIRELLDDSMKLTLYGYATYSESLLVNIMNIIRKVNPKVDVDYAVLEREEEHRNLMHTDKIRYNQLFKNKEDRQKHFQQRKVVVIVPINSTLKTHGRLINLFRKENNMGSDNDWILDNYALILVGANSDNKYWKLNRETHRITDNIHPEPIYFIELKVTYNEALNCELCFPENPVEEIPLIEVNAASTIPNQAFGIVKTKSKSVDKINYNMIEEEEQKIDSLKSCLLYGHISRKEESHFLYYFQTEYLFALKKEEIRASIVKWKEEHNHTVEKNEYNLIVTPLHFSNAGFVEMINEVVFEGKGMILRTDFDKEYRSNAYAKYSNIRNFIRQRQACEEKSVFRVHFVDDNIITGRTFQRARSLVESVINLYEEDYSNVSIRIFDKIFVLLDRNSKSSRMQYIRCWDPKGRNSENLEKEFYSYVHLNISSLRTYGDSCVLCNLKKESELLYQTSSTNQIAEYWRKSIGKFRVHSLTEMEDGKSADGMFIRPDDYNDRAYRRMACTHIAKSLLDRGDNSRDTALLLLLQVINRDYEGRKKDRFEFFLSYLKVVSRPFLVFHKPIKEVVFDILLLMIESMVEEKSIQDIVTSLKEKKPYLGKTCLKPEWRYLEEEILKSPDRTADEKKDLLLVIMKQLTELKSNYIIRISRMNKIFKFAHDIGIMDDAGKKADFTQRYLLLIKKLVGVSSDTSKSLWLDHAVREKREVDGNETVDTGSIPGDFLQWIALENTRVFRDGIDKLFREQERAEEFSDELKKYFDTLSCGNEYQSISKRMGEFESSKLESSTNEEIEAFLQKNLRDNLICTKGTISTLKANESDMKKIFRRIYKQIKEESLRTKQTAAPERLKEIMNSQDNRYQYHHFFSILEAYNMCVINEETGEVTMTDEGVETVACCLGIYQICEQRNTEASKEEEKEQEVIGKIRRLAIMMQRVLHSFKLQVVMEKENNTDWWKEKIVEQFNTQIVDPLPGTKDAKPYLKVKYNRSYMLLADSMGESCENEIVEDEVMERLNQFREEKVNTEAGYQINLEESYFIWKIGKNLDHDMLLYAELNPEESEMAVYNSIRSVMLFYNLLENRLFNNEESNVLHELMIARGELAVYNRDKSHSHTKNDVIQSQYRQALCAEEKSDGVTADLYRSYILTLLADLNVSEIYRNSLKPKFYQQRIEYDYNIYWGDADSIFHSCREFYVTYGVASGSVRVRVQQEVLLEEDEAITDNECMLCGSDSKRQLCLLLFSLAMNAAGKGRGKAENGVIHVYFSKTKEGNLRVMNEACNNRFDIQKINREIQLEPEKEERGISLWGMSRYIKRVLCCMIMDSIEKWKQSALNKNQIEEYRRQIERMLSSEFELKVEKKELDNRVFFSIQIPVLKKKYTDLLFAGKES